MQRVAISGCSLPSGETLLAYLHEKSKMNETGFLLWRKVVAVGWEEYFWLDSGGMSPVVGSHQSAATVLTGWLSGPLPWARLSSTCFVCKNSRTTHCSSVESTVFLSPFYTRGN